MRKKNGIVVIILDQSVGQLQVDGKTIVGVELWPETLLAIEKLEKQGLSLFLNLPVNIEAEDLARIQDLVPVKLLATPSLETLFHRPEFLDPEEPIIFVSIDRNIRQRVIESRKVDAVPHLAVVEWILQGNLVFGKIQTFDKPNGKMNGLIPYYIEKLENTWLTLGLVSESALLRFLKTGAFVDLLPFDFRKGDCGFLRLDSPQDLKEFLWEGTSLLFSDKNRLLCAFYGPDLIQTATIPSAHGALEMLVPSPGLLLPVTDPDSFTRRAIGLASALKEVAPDLIETEIPPMPPGQQLLFSLPDAQNFQTDAERYSGIIPAGSGGLIMSRHIRHPDNLRTKDLLISELTALGYITYEHSFSYNGSTFQNVIADMPGTGYLYVKVTILQKILEILRMCPRPCPWPKIEKQMEKVLGPKVIKELNRRSGKPLKWEIEELVGAYRWLPFTKLKQYRLGFGAQIVVAGCHFDSTAAGTPGGYNPQIDPAPGMDDNASGMAACLGAARYLMAFKGQLTHTIRFCFFNAEEAGMVGSKSYAAHLKSTSAPVKAVLCADMIGYNSDANNIFEIHAGYTDPAIRDLNLPASSMVDKWAISMGQLQPAQVYKGTSPSVGAPDRNLCDPAINRSDHAAFHQQGYPAVLISADYFANLPSEPYKDPNPNYHTNKDKNIDANYGVAIAAALACALKELACN